MALISIFLAILIELIAMASSILLISENLYSSFFVIDSWYVSAPMQTSCMAFTVSIGWFPIAVSAESITASVPSKTALETSVISALVGVGFVIIDSII